MKNTNFEKALKEGEKIFLDILDKATKEDSRIQILTDVGVRVSALVFALTGNDEIVMTKYIETVKKEAEVIGKEMSKIEERQ